MLEYFDIRKRILKEIEKTLETERCKNLPLGKIIGLAAQDDPYNLSDVEFLKRVLKFSEIAKKQKGKTAEV